MSSDAAVPMPTFIVIGAQKGGTHWIRDNLSVHPSIFVPERELQYFTRPRLVEERGAEGYRRLFAGWDGAPVVGEVTPGYLTWQHRPGSMASAMHAIVPHARLIAILRDPVERARSALAQQRRLRPGPHDDEDLAQAFRRLAQDGDPLGLVASGCYAACLRPYLERFGEQVLVVLNDDLYDDPGAVYDRLLTHIGLAPGFRPETLDALIHSYDAARYGVPPIDGAERAELFAPFERDVAELEVLLGRNLSSWRAGTSARPDGERRARAPARTSAAVDLPGHAPHTWPRELRTRAVEPVVVRKFDGSHWLVEGDVVRPISSPIVARALQHRFGRADLSMADFYVLLPGPPVVLLKAMGESAFVVVGGKRLPVPGVGLMLHTSPTAFEALEAGPPLDVLRAAAEMHGERDRSAPDGQL